MTSRKKKKQEVSHLYDHIVDSDKASVFQIGMICLQLLLNESQSSMYDYKFKVIKWDLLTIQINQVKTAYGENMADLLAQMLSEQPE